MIPVATIVTLIEAVSVLTQVGISTAEAIHKLKNGKPDEIDIAELQRQLMMLPNLTDLYRINNDFAISTSDDINQASGKEKENPDE